MLIYDCLFNKIFMNSFYSSNSIVGKSGSRYIMTLTNVNCLLRAGSGVHRHRAVVSGTTIDVEL